MIITDDVKNFIEQNIELIENKNFLELYHKAAKRFNIIQSPIGELTSVLYEAGIDPLEGQTFVPPFFFYQSNTVDSFIVPSSCKQLSSFSFDCSSVTQLLFEEGCETIESYALSECSKLHHIILPKTLKLISKNAFRENISLNTIHYKGKKLDWMIIEKEPDWYYNCPQLHQVTCIDGQIILPNKIKYI